MKANELPTRDVWIKAHTPAGVYHLHRSPGGWGGYDLAGNWRMFHPSHIESYTLLDEDRPYMVLTITDVVKLLALLALFVGMVVAGLKVGGFL